MIRATLPEVVPIRVAMDAALFLAVSLGLRARKMHKRARAKASKDVA